MEDHEYESRRDDRAIEEMEFEELNKKIQNVFAHLEGMRNKISKKQDVVVEQKDSVKLIKNTKGYQWEIKLVAKEGVNLLEQLDYVDNELRKKYGNGEKKEED